MEGLTKKEKEKLNKKIIEYNKTRVPLPVFLEILDLDLSERPRLKDDLYKVIEKIAWLQPVENYK